MTLSMQQPQFPTKRRKARVIPFGYQKSESDDKILEPIQEELEALEQAKVYLDNSSYREVANWVTKKTGRYISHVGLLKAVNRYWREWYTASKTQEQSGKEKGIKTHCVFSKGKTVGKTVHEKATD